MIDILGSLDDKIENNEQLSIELQNYCIKKFDVMFSDTDLCPLSDIANITMGQSPDGNSYNESGNGMIFFQGRTDFGFRYPSIRLYTTEPKRIAQKGDILLSVRAPVGDINMAFEDCCIGRGLATISSSINAFIYYALLAKKQDFDIYNNAGTIFGSINKEALSQFKVPFNGELVNKFLEFARSINDKIFMLAQETLELNELKQLYLKKFFG